MAKLLPFPAPAAGELEERLATDQAANHRTATQLTASWGAQPAWAAAPRQGAWPGCQASRTGSSPAWCCLAALFCCSGSVPLLQGCSFCATSAQRSTHFPGSSRASCRAPAYLPACSACCVCPSTQAAAVAGPPPPPSPGHASCGGRRPQPWRKTLLSSSGSGPRSRARVSGGQAGGRAACLPAPSSSSSIRAPSWRYATLQCSATHRALLAHAARVEHRQPLPRRLRLPGCQRHCHHQILSQGGEL